MINKNLLTAKLSKFLLESILDESKQLGTVYHFTNFKGLNNILASNTFKGSYANVDKDDLDFKSFGMDAKKLKDKGIYSLYFFSTTRDKLLYIKDPKIKGSVVRIVLDGDKLTNKYKVSPYYFYHDEMIDEPNPKYDQDESEERIILGTKTEIPNASNYIKEIHIILDKVEDNQNYLDQIKTIVDKYGYFVKCYYKEKPISLEDYQTTIVPNIAPRVDEISLTAMNSVKKYAEEKLSPLDINFTHHFFDRLNDPRNIKPISEEELVRFFEKLSEKKDQLIDFLNQYNEVIVKDDLTNINIPLILSANKIFAKTVMRKKNFLSSNPKIEFIENLSLSESYGNDLLNNIDIKKYIASLTEFMLDKGMNIEPLPRIKFIHGDEKNANDFFGTTAYYSPGNCSITLYTCKRHPKDIVRSFSHEMIHRIQDNEDRLNNISTTNINEDEKLKELEREAYEKGNMCFREWENSIRIK
jgi:hypothetical protein